MIARDRFPTLRSRGCVGVISGSRVGQELRSCRDEVRGFRVGWDGVWRKATLLPLLIWGLEHCRQKEGNLKLKFLHFVTHWHEDHRNMRWLRWLRVTWTRDGYHIKCNWPKLPTLKLPMLRLFVLCCFGHLHCVNDRQPQTLTHVLFSLSVLR